ncbi:MAG: DUF1003 domain-containing protein [Candidatus Nanoarchaeia archaeon]|nr:DUF1003 domain-containing protein [Candidatus Nanoarchaeia archaeon]
MKKKSNNSNHKKNHPALQRKDSVWQRAADKLTKGIGSWNFVLVLLIFILVWTFINIQLSWRWDPYPHVFLNLVLGCLTALTAPLILMSQNRQEQRDRIDFKYNYGVNRKAEREIQKIQKELDTIKEYLYKNLKK